MNNGHRAAWAGAARCRVHACARLRPQTQAIGETWSWRREAHGCGLRRRGRVSAREAPQAGRAVLRRRCDEDERRAGRADGLRGREAADPVVVALEGALLLELTPRRPQEHAHRCVHSTKEQQPPAQSAAQACGGMPGREGGGRAALAGQNAA